MAAGAQDSAKSFFIWDLSDYGADFYIDRYLLSFTMPGLAESGFERRAAIR